MLKRYVSEVHQVDLKEFDHVVVLQNNICGSCSSFTFEFLKESSKVASCKVLFILSKEDSILASDLKQWYALARILEDGNGMLGRYGLQLSRDGYYTLDTGIVSGHCEIREELHKELISLQRKEKCYQ